jgi:hypothetical protein
MKIAITGHSDGIGKAIYDLLKEHNQIDGYSIDSGYDIGEEKTRSEIINLSKDVDVFINNAYHSSGQVDLLKKLLDVWQGQNKIIININSKAVFCKDINSDAIWNNIDAKYIESKQQLQDIIEKNREKLPRLCNIIIGWADTSMSKYVTSPKLSTLEVSNFIKYVIENRTDVWIQQAVICSPDSAYEEMDQQ